MSFQVSGDAATTRTNLGLGDAATKTVGTASGNIPVLDSSGDLAASTYTNTVYTHPTTAGNKHIPTAGAADQVLTYSASGTATWADAAGGVAGISTGSTSGTAINIDSSNRVTMDSVPSFRAGRTADVTHGASTTIIFNGISGSGRHNNGGHYDATTGIFTAPVAGRYHFGCKVILMGVANAYDATDLIQFKYNGSSGINYSDRRGKYEANVTGTNGYYTDWMYDTFSLSAGNTIQVQINKGAQIHGNPNYTIFWGFLIG